MPSQKLLFIEDDLVLGDLLMEMFCRTRHGVSWFVRARVSPDGLVLMDANGVERLLVPEDYELALVDYRLKGSELDGPEVTSYLVARKIPVVGISGLPQLNSLLINAGARGGVAKDDLFSRILRGQLVIRGDFAGVS